MLDLLFSNYESAVITKNIIVSIISFGAGGLVAAILVIYKYSLIRFDEKGILENEDIEMIFIETNGKTKIIVPKRSANMSERITRSIIFLLYKLGFKKKFGKVTWKDAKKTKIITGIFFAFLSVLFILFVLSPFTVTLPEEIS